MLIRICNFRARNSCSNFQCWSNVCNQKFMSHKIFCAFIETKPINNIRKYRPQTCGIKTQLGEINVHLIVKLFQQKIDKSDSQSFCTIRRKISSKLFFFSSPTFSFSPHFVMDRWMQRFVCRFNFNASLLNSVVKPATTELNRNRASKKRARLNLCSVLSGKTEQEVLEHPMGSDTVILNVLSKISLNRNYCPRPFLDLCFCPFVYRLIVIEFWLLEKLPQWQRRIEIQFHDNQFLEHFNNKNKNDKIRLNWKLLSVMSFQDVLKYAEQEWS